MNRFKKQWISLDIPEEEDFVINIKASDLVSMITHHAVLSRAIGSRIRDDSEAARVATENQPIDVVLSVDMLYNADNLVAFGNDLLNTLRNMNRNESGVVEDQIPLPFVIVKDEERRILTLN